MKKVIIEVPFIPDEYVAHDAAKFICNYTINDNKYTVALNLGWKEFAELEEKHAMGTIDSQVNNISKQRLMYYILEQIKKGTIPINKVIKISMSDIINIKKVSEKDLPTITKWETNI